jgi:hemin uptake protein HemP
VTLSKKPEAPPRFPPDELAAASASDRVCSKELFKGARQLLIEHGGQVYILRITQNDKLILTK